MLLGVAVFFVFCGWWVLIPTNIAWLDFADRAMHQLGWMFYREPFGRREIMAMMVIFLGVAIVKRYGQRR